MQQTQIQAGAPPSYNQPAGYIQPAIQPNQFVVVPTSNVVNSYQHRQSTALSVTLLVVGTLSMICNTVDLAVTPTDMYDVYSMEFVGHGFWNGGLCIIAGGLGIGAGQCKTICMIRAFMVMSIIAACTCLGQLITGTMSATIFGQRYSGDGCKHDSSSSRYSYYYRQSTLPCSEIQTAVAMEALLAVLALVGGVAAIWGSALCCKAACWCGDPPRMIIQYDMPMTVMTQQQQPQAPAMFAVAQPAPVYYPPAPGYQYNVAPPTTAVQKSTPTQDPAHAY